MTVFAKFPDFSRFHKILILDNFEAKILNQEIYLMPSNLMILLVLLYVYYLLQKLRLYKFQF